MKKTLFLTVLSASILSSGAFAQKPAQKAPAKTAVAKPAVIVPTPAPEPVLMTVGGENVTRSEFERVYKKNNRDSVFTEAGIREYLDLYTNYKLKVKEAESLKMDTSEAFVNELAGYRKQLAQPYLTDKDVNEKLIQEAYDRLSKDVHAAHILIKLPEDALPKDTVIAYNRILKIRDMIMKGSDFGKVARDSSQDPSAKENMGDLGYFTGMQMVYPFESVAYSTKPGQISMPVRTRFGYHLIKVIDSRNAVGEVHAAHIMVRFPKEMNDSVATAAEKKINEAYASLKAGMPWDTAVTRYSEDKGSVKRGGELPWFGTGKMVPEFEKAAFALQNDNDYAAPVRTNYGWHIIRRLERRGLPKFEDKRNELKQMIARDSRNEASKQSMVARIKKDYAFTEILKNRDEFVAVLDTNLSNGEWDQTKADHYNKPLMSLKDADGKVTTYTQMDFAKFINLHQTKRPNTNPQAIGFAMYNDFVADRCLAFEEAHLDVKYADFRNLMKEYRDGILLFDLTDKMVWSKAVKDTAGLQSFYEKNKNNYMWGERCDATIYSVADAKSAKDLVAQLRKGKKTEEEIMASINKKGPGTVVKKEGRYNKGDEMCMAAGWKEGVSDPITKEDKITVVNIRKIIAPMPKTLEEAKGVITADYQNYLEKDWMTGLKAKYPVQVNDAVLQSFWKK